MKHLLIPDCQIRPGVPIQHLDWIGKFIIDKKPDVIIQIGDFADMTSLSSYEKSTVKAEQVRYHADIQAARDAMEVLLRPLKQYNLQRSINKKKQYKPRMVLTLGNHEERINRYVNAVPELHEHLSVRDLGYEGYGWEVYPFLQPVEIHGILYSHYFPRNAKGQINQSYRGSPSAQAQCIREAQSATSGHQQGLDFHIQQTNTKRLYGLIAGSCYLHDEDYLTPQGTEYWRGVIMKHQVRRGEYDPMFVSLKYLKERYG